MENKQIINFNIYIILVRYVVVIGDVYKKLV